MSEMTHKRRHGLAIVDTDEGILVFLGRNKLFILPGGGAGREESREKAALRELRGRNRIDREKLAVTF